MDLFDTNADDILTQIASRMHRTGADRKAVMVPVNVDEIPTYDAAGRAALHRPTIAGADYRPIEPVDVRGAMAGLRMAFDTPAMLAEHIKRHARIDMFASAVIVAAATAQLYRLDGLDLSQFSMAELVAMRRTTDDGACAAVEHEITVRADAIREAEAMCRVGVHSWCDERGMLPADTKCDYCDELYGEPK